MDVREFGTEIRCPKDHLYSEKMVKIYQFLLAVLGNEDYVDVSTLMLKITNYH